MNIAEVARRAGLPAKTIRYYEEIGLITPLRSANGYRAFRDSDLHKLEFLGRARSLGFSIEECRALLQLYADKARASQDVKAIAARHLDQIAAKIAELQAMERTLTSLVQACAGDHRPDCPILTGLSVAAHSARRQQGRDQAASSKVLSSVLPVTSSARVTRSSSA